MLIPENITLLQNVAEMRHFALQSVTSTHPIRINSKFAPLRPFLLCLYRLDGRTMIQAVGTLTNRLTLNLNFMSKGSEFWGNASGKLGQQVLYRAGGEQRARMYVDKIKNPKSYAQMSNRLLMNNVVSAFRVLKPLLKEAFPTRKTNQSAFNAFVQANKNVNRFYIGKEEMEAGACVPYGLTIARGSLGISLQPKLSKITNARDVDSSPKFGWTIQGLLNLSGYTMAMTSGDPRNGDPVIYLSEAEIYELFKTRCIVQLPSEFQLSVVSAIYGDADADLNIDIWQPSFRVIHAQEYNPYSVNYGMQVNANNMRIGLHIASHTTNDDDEDVFTFDYLVIGNQELAADTAAQAAVGLVLSYKDATGTQVSTSRIGVVPSVVDGASVENPTSDFIEGGIYFEQIMEAYGYKPEGILVSQTENKPEEDPIPDEPEGV